MQKTSGSVRTWPRKAARRGDGTTLSRYRQCVCMRVTNLWLNSLSLSLSPCGSIAGALPRENVRLERLLEQETRRADEADGRLRVASEQLNWAIPQVRLPACPPARPPARLSLSGVCSLAPAGAHALDAHSLHPG